MSVEITTAEKIRRLPWNIALNALNSVYAQLTFFGSAFILFLNELGASNSQIGFLLSMLPFFGVIALFIAPLVARFGYKRTYVTFFGIRKFITAGLLLVPWVVHQFGTSAALLLITLVVMGFALCRAVAETGLYPWAQEYIPDSIRGKHAALNDMIARLTGIAAVAVGGYLLSLSEGIERFTLLFAIAVAFGIAATWSAAHLPGGAPVKTKTASYRGFLTALRDRNFARYLAGLGIMAFAGAPLAFIPIFMSQEVGLSDSSVVYLQIGGIVGGLAVVYLMGWAADRYGSKPVMLTGLYAKALLPLAWILMPRHSELSLPIALIIAAVQGIIDIGWAIGSGRLLFTSVVPREKKGDYMAVFYAGIGLIGGVSQILSGVILDATANVTGQIGPVSIDQFTPLFVGSMILTGISIIVFHEIKADSEVSVRDFAGMFTHGNPIVGLQNVMRYHRAKDERAMVHVTGRMGHTNSPLAVDELIEALTDPRFNVRFEAIISIAHMNPDARLVEALCDLIDEGTELSLSVVAAWSLGRMGDERALPTLRRALSSQWRSIQAHAARALGMLGDTTVGPVLLERLKTETDKGLRIAFASALGQMEYEEALDAIFVLLDETSNKGARLELALALTRMVGDEQQFVRLHRGFQTDPGTAASQAVMALKRPLGRVSEELKDLVDTAASDFARSHFAEGQAHLVSIIEKVTQPHMDNACNEILRETAARIPEHGMDRSEYLLIALVLLRDHEVTASSAKNLP